MVLICGFDSSLNGVLVAQHACGHHGKRDHLGSFLRDGDHGLPARCAPRDWQGGVPRRTRASSGAGREVLDRLPPVPITSDLFQRVALALLTGVCFAAGQSRTGSAQSRPSTASQTTSWPSWPTRTCCWACRTTTLGWCRPRGRGWRGRGTWSPMSVLESGTP